ncbi:Uncharacterized protein K02A2.6 [Exaiptasia diaphana]|nr:Uncharacterized protein K02A2.6 [Exaiptasia diaphana]
MNQKMPSKVPLHPWEWATFPWQRIHIDFAGPFKDSMFFVVVDAHSKWPEVIPMKSTTSSKTIEVLRNLFARFGIPEQLVSDNGPQFVSDEFQTFMKSNGIRHITSAPYHPATNGLAERSVQTFKQALKSMEGSSSPLKEKLAKFLINYRNTPHLTTGESPAQMMLGRPLRTRLDLVKPNRNRKMLNKQHEQSMQSALHNATPARQIALGDTVMARDYRGDYKWRQGPLMYKVQVSPNLIWRRHIDQLLPTMVQQRVPQDSDISEHFDTAKAVPDPGVPAPMENLPTEANSQEMRAEQSVIINSPARTPTPAQAATPVERRYPQRERKAPQKLDL